MSLNTLTALTTPRAVSLALGRTTGIEPFDPIRGYAPGPAPYRVLLVGGALLQGKGVLTHDLALPGSLARSLKARLVHGIDVDVAWAPRTSIEALDALVESNPLHRYDALVLLVDPPRFGAERFAGRLAGLVARWASLMPPAATRTVVMVAPRPASRSAAPYRAFTALVQAATATTARYVELATDAVAQAPADRYVSWADQIAAVITCRLHEPAVWSDATDLVDEERRAQAVDRLLPLDDRWEATFRRVVSLASAAYGTRRAALSVIDRDTTCRIVQRGLSARRLPRSDTICDKVLATYGGIITGDARADPRFADLRGVRYGDVRFFAGYRICDPDGMPVAALCVSDPEPRPVLTQDLALLRDFAHTAERRLWNLVHGGVASSGPSPAR